MDRIEETIKPRVLIIIATDPIGGPGKGLLQFIKYASPDEFHYVLCNFRFKDRPLGQFCKEAMKNGINLKLLNQRAVIDPTLVLQVSRTIRENKINIIQTHGYKGNIIGYFASRIHGIPWVAFAHGFTSDNRKMEIYNHLDKMVLRKADRVVVVSNALRSLLERSGIGGPKINIIHNAIDLNEATPEIEPYQIKERYGLKEHHKIIGVVGRLNPEKGHMVYLRGMRDVVRVHPETRTLIIGNGQERRALEEYCSLHHLKEHVIFTGYHSNVANFYQIMDLLVLPSLSEGLPNTVLEAMAFGVPVIGTSVGGVPEVIDGLNGTLVPANDPITLAMEMIELLGSEEKRKALGVRGRESLFPSFSPSIRSRKFLDLYAEVLSIGHP